MAKYHYIVRDNKLLTPSVRLVTLACDDEAKPLLFEPGQYATISLHDRLRPTAARCFSIASSPTNRQILEFGARVGGEYTAALERLEVGDLIVVRGPFGSFILKEHKYRDLVFLAGGIGVTPFMSMIRYATDLRLLNNIHLIYSCRNQNDIPFFGELVTLQRHNPHLRVTFVVAEGETDRLYGLEVISGRIDETTFPRLGLRHQREIYMMCGPPGFMRAMHKLLVHHGVPGRNILSEAFGQGSSRNQSSRLARWPVNAYALSGVSLLAAGFFVVTSDLMKTLPALEAAYEPVALTVSTSTESLDGVASASIQALGPQVDTNITPEPVIRHVVNKDAIPAETAAPAPAVTQTPTSIATPTPAPKAVTPPPKVVSTTQAPKPAPTPTKTVQTTARSRTQVS